MQHSVIADRCEKQLDSCVHYPTRPSAVTVIDCAVGSATELLAPSTLDRLEQAVARIEDDSVCNVVVFRDLGIVRYSVPDMRPDISLYRKWEQLFDRIRNLPAVNVATVDGVCAGLHFELALVVDVCLSSDESSFTTPEIAHGHLPGMSIFRLAKQIGLGPARRLMLQGNAWSARIALDHGLIDDICTAADIDQRIARISGRFTRNNIVAVQLCRRLLEESFSTSYEDSLGHFLAAQHRCFSTPSRK